MENNEYMKWRKSLLSTSGFTKLIRYIEEIVDTEEFQKITIEMRIKYSIPADGLQPKDKSRFYLPKDHFSSLDDGALDSFHEDIDKYARKYHITFYDSFCYFGFYFFYNELSSDVAFQPRGLCRMIDIEHEFEEAAEFSDHDRKLFPIALAISPYASKRDIMRFVEKLYISEIKPSQEYYKDKNISLGKHRKRSDGVKKRNDIIYKNKHLSLQEIGKIISEELGPGNVTDLGLIGKIKSLENKKRN